MIDIKIKLCIKNNYQLFINLKFMYAPSKRLNAVIQEVIHAQRTSVIRTFATINFISLYALKINGSEFKKRI